jgi:hypothetical protein
MADDPRFPSSGDAPDPESFRGREHLGSRDPSPARPTGDALRRAFEPNAVSSAFGAASISLLLDLLRDRLESGAWSPARARVHALALLELVPDFDFTGDELALLGRAIAEDERGLG